EPQRAGERSGDLRDLERVGEPGAVVVALVRDEHLGLVRQPAERGRMDDAVAVAAEIAAGPARGLGMEAAAGGARSGRVGAWGPGGARASRRDRNGWPRFAWLTPTGSALNYPSESIAMVEP